MPVQNDSKEVVRALRCTQGNAELPAALPGERLRDTVFDLIGQAGGEKLQDGGEGQQARRADAHCDADLSPAMHDSGDYSNGAFDVALWSPSRCRPSAC